LKRGALAALVCSLLLAHEGGMHNLQPTKAAADLKRAREALDAAKRKLAARGRYACCVKPSCNLCARVNGSCNCAANVAAGKGACGECYAGWKNGRGAVKGVDPKSVALLTADHQSCPLPANPPEIPQPELDAAAEALMRAKRILAGEKRFACCIRGGCGQCAHEGACPCGGDLASRRKGVCGECFDRWRAGQGAFDGIDPMEVTLALPAGGWMIMPSGQLFGVYSDQSGARGRDKLFSTNWFMLMASHRLGPGELLVRSMLSLEPATITGKRYPLLFATGETANGIPIINGQHPHDFFMELAAQYKIGLGEKISVHVYGGPRGEPALGPTAYPHRASASEDPVAVIAHHSQDSTHISTNVATAGVSYGPVTWEISGFHGREPDEKRWGIESGAIDSLSSRLSVNTAAGWSGQFSMGRINRAETVHPLRPALRSTASLAYARRFTGAEWNTSLIWGRNHELEYTQLPNLPVFPLTALALRPRHIVSVPTRIPGQIYNSFLAESTLRWKRNWIWGRAESADKDSTLLFEEAPFVLLVDENRLARVQAYTAGYEREVPSGLPRVSAGIGGQFTLFHAPPLLAPIYGTNPTGLQVFFRLRLR
jgi:hypothetical protein